MSSVFLCASAVECQNAVFMERVSKKVKWKIESKFVEKKEKRVLGTTSFALFVLPSPTCIIQTSEKTPENVQRFFSTTFCPADEKLRLISG